MIDSALKSQQLALARALLAERIALKPDNRLTLERYASLLETLGEPGASEIRERLAATV